MAKSKIMLSLLILGGLVTITAISLGIISQNKLKVQRLDSLKGSHFALIDKSTYEVGGIKNKLVEFIKLDDQSVIKSIDLNFCELNNNTYLGVYNISKANNLWAVNCKDKVVIFGLEGIKHQLSYSDLDYDIGGYGNGEMFIMNKKGDTLAYPSKEKWALSIYDINSKLKNNYIIEPLREDIHTTNSDWGLGVGGFIGDQDEYVLLFRRGVPSVVDTNTAILLNLENGEVKNIGSKDSENIYNDPVSLFNSMDDRFNTYNRPLDNELNNIIRKVNLLTGESKDYSMNESFGTTSSGDNLRYVYGAFENGRILLANKGTSGLAGAPETYFIYNLETNVKEFTIPMEGYATLKNDIIFVVTDDKSRVFVRNMISNENKEYKLKGVESIIDFGIVQ